MSEMRLADLDNQNTDTMSFLYGPSAKGLTDDVGGPLSRMLGFRGLGADRFRCVDSRPRG